MTKSKRVEGVVGLAHNKRGAAIATVHCDTDFAARTPELKKFTHELALYRLDSVTRYTTPVAYANGYDYIFNRLRLARSKLKESIELGSHGTIKFRGDYYGTYVHHDYRIAATIDIQGGNEELADNLAQHIAFANPDSRYDILEQTYIKDDCSIANLLTAHDATIIGFIRQEVGE